MSFKIDKIDTLPPATKKSSEVYDKILADISKRTEGVYLITLDSVKVNTLYTGLSKKIKNHKDMKLHKITKKVYIEKVKKT
jgi:hypothetical protein